VSKCQEIQGVSQIILYENKDIILHRPDISVIDEIDKVTNTGYIIYTELNQESTWKRLVSYSGNYKQVFSDFFSFNLHGINDLVRFELDFLRLNRRGFIVELQMTDGNVYVFPTPVFVSKIYEKKENVRVWSVELNYRVPTFLDYLKKNNKDVVIPNFLLWSDNQNDIILASESKGLIYK